MADRNESTTADDDDESIPMMKEIMKMNWQSIPINVSCSRKCKCYISSEKEKKIIITGHINSKGTDSWAFAIRFLLRSLLSVTRNNQFKGILLIDFRTRFSTDAERKSNTEQKADKREKTHKHTNTIRHNTFY